MTLAAAVALGPLLAPPAAEEALAVMRSVALPHRIRPILEGESLLIDASSLLVYNLAVTAVAAGGFHVSDAFPAFALVTIGSVVVAWLLALAVVPFPFAGYHLYDPSRRQPSAAFTLLVDVLRYRS